MFHSSDVFNAVMAGRGLVYRACGIVCRRRHRRPDHHTHRCRKIVVHHLLAVDQNLVLIGKDKTGLVSSCALRADGGLPVPGLIVVRVVGASPACGIRP